MLCVLGSQHLAADLDGELHTEPTQRRVISFVQEEVMGQLGPGWPSEGSRILDPVLVDGSWWWSSTTEPVVRVGDLSAA